MDEEELIGQDDRSSVLIVEDDAAVASGLVTGLKNVGFNVELTTDGETGTKRALSGDFDLIILDLNLPERDGFDVLEALSGRVSTPVIVLTARTELETRLKSFSLGAVDYIPKPFWMEELVARIQSRLRLRQDEPHRVISWANVVIDLTSHGESRPRSLSLLRMNSMSCALVSDQIVRSASQRWTTLYRTVHVMGEPLMVTCVEFAMNRR